METEQIVPRVFKTPPPLEERKMSTLSKLEKQRHRSNELESLLEEYKKSTNSLNEKNFKLEQDVFELESSISILNHLVSERDDEIDRLKDELQYAEENRQYYREKNKQFESLLDRSLEKIKNYQDKVTDVETNRCQVCFYFEKIIILNCGHKELCCSCIQKMCEDNRPNCPNCPICREKVVSATVLFSS